MILIFLAASLFFGLEPKDKEARLGVKIPTADKCGWAARRIIECFTAESTLYSYRDPAPTVRLFESFLAQ